MIGSFGDIVFETSDEKILTPMSMTRTGGAVWADHPMLYKKPKREFMHSESRGVELEIKLKASLGVSPAKSIDALYKLMENGRTHPLVVGGRPMSRYDMAVMTISDAWDEVLSGGELISATVSVKFEEAK